MTTRILILIGAITLLVACPESNGSSPLGTAFTYQGHLKDGGSPANGAYDFEFFLYDSEEVAAASIAGPVVVEDVQVTDGLFAVEIDFGEQFNGDERWLQIGVRPAGALAYFTELSGRQKLTAAPHAQFSSRPWATTGDHISNTNTGNVGIGTATPTARLHVDGDIQSTGGISADGALSVGGDISADGALWIAGGGGVLDQSQELASGSAGGTEVWQSFTPGVSGAIVNVSVRVSGVATATSALLAVYEGHGIGGTLLTSGSVQIPVGTEQWVDLPVASPPVLQAGQQYTFRMFNSSGGLLFRMASGDPYPGGSMGNSSIDLAFRTYVRSAPNVLTVAGGASFAGNVGIRTTSPSARLSLGPDNANTKLAIWDIGTGPSQMMGIGVGPAQFRLHLPDSTNRFVFLDEPDGSALVTIRGTGNVSIGPGITNDKLGVEAGLLIDAANLAEGPPLSGEPYRGLRMGGPNSGEGISSNRTVGSDNQSGLDFYTARAARLSITNSGNVGIGTQSPSQRLHVVGNICATGTIGVCSDARFKEHVEPVAGALEKVDRLRGVAFDWKREEFPDHQFAEDRQLGFIAQEVEKVLPQVVSRGADGYLSVDYGRLTPVLVEALRELRKLHSNQLAQRDARIDLLEREIQELKALFRHATAAKGE